MNEIFVTSSTNEKVELIKVWDSKTTTEVMSYRGDGKISPKGIGILGADYLVAADKSKPVLKLWQLNSQQGLHAPRLVCPGKVSVLAASPDGYYIAVGVEEKLHVYQVSSGSLVGSGVHHFQAITVIRWCCDGSIIACGGEDGMITVWYLSDLIQRNLIGTPDPYYTFSDHSLPVTDLIITTGGSSCSRSRLISVSCDKTCKIRDLSTGNLLLSVVFGEMLTSVATTPSNMEIYIGTMAGDINEFSLRNPKNLSSEIHVNSCYDNEENLVNVLSGHEKTVTCLSVSLEGDRLLSGSNDETVRIWHLSSKQCLKVLSLNGPVMNAFFTIMPKQMLTPDVKRNIIVRPFQKTVDIGSDECSLEIICNDDLSISNYAIDRFIDNDVFTKRSNLSSGPQLKINDSLAEEVNRLRAINAQLFQISVKSLMKKRVEKKSVANGEVELPPKCAVDEPQPECTPEVHEPETPPKKKRKRSEETNPNMLTSNFLTSCMNQARDSAVHSGKIKQKKKSTLSDKKKRLKNKKKSTKNKKKLKKQKSKNK